MIPDGFNRRGVTFILVEVRQFVWIIFEIVKLPLVELIKMHEFVTLGTNPIMPRHHVDAWILVVVVIDARSPIGWSFTFEERHEGATLHVGGDRCLSHVQESLGVIEILDHIFVDGPGLSDSRPFDDERHLQRFFVHPTLVVPTVVTDIESLIRGVNHHGILGEAQVLKGRHQSANTLVNTLDAPKIVFGVSLVLPAYKLFTR